jgi:hypothetical protein
MRSMLVIAGFAVAVAATPATSEAACSKRTTGTVIGAVTGGLLGHAVAGRGSHTEGTLIGADKCKSHRRAAYRAPARRAAAAPAYARNDVCRYENRAYYDAYGQMVYAPTRVCGR